MVGVPHRMQIGQRELTMIPVSSDHGAIVCGVCRYIAPVVSEDVINTVVVVWLLGSHALATMHTTNVQASPK
jgi:hypothetical protein